MKLTVEIKDEEFIFSYTFKESNHTSTRHVCADSIVAFANILKYASDAFKWEEKQWEREVMAKAYAEKKPKDAK